MSIFRVYIDDDYDEDVDDEDFYEDDDDEDPEPTTPPTTTRFRRRRLKRRSTVASSSNETTTKGFYFVKDFPLPLFDGRRRRRKREAYLDPEGRYQNCRINSLLIVAKRNKTDRDGKSYNLFNREMLEEIERLESEIFQTYAIVSDGKDGGKFYYQSQPGMDNGICTRQPTGECGGFNLRVMKSMFPSSSNNPLDIIFSKIPGLGLTYPHYMNYDLSQFFGRVETVDNEHNGLVKHIGAIREVYCANEYQSDWFKRHNKVWKNWEWAFDETIRKFSSPYFDVYWMAEYQKQAEQDFLIKDMLPKVGVTFIALMLWCTVGALMNDAVRSKPWAGIIGVFATLLGCVAGFGICLWITPRFWPIIMAVPLLTLAIGLDDMFILLEAWSHTNPALPVEERIMLSMNVGGTSIVITFFINMLDFFIGNYTPYPLIQALSKYAIATMVLDFFFQMTIFCAGLSLFGKNEDDNRHACCCCLKLPTRKELLQKNSTNLRNVKAFDLLCCAGGVPKDEISTDDNADDETWEFHEKISKFISSNLTKLSFRIFAICTFFLYLSASIYSITQMQIGLKPERIYRRSSNLFDYAYFHRSLFTAYSNEIMVVVHNAIDYSDPEIQRNFVNFLNKVHETGYFWGEEETKCWIVDFIKWAQVNDIDLRSMKSNRDIIERLRQYPGGFLASANPKTFTSYSSHAKDIRIAANGTVIRKSRFRFRARNMTGPDRQIGMMTSMRKLIDRYRPQIHMFAYTADFQMYDQYLTAVPATLYYCGMTLGCTFVVALFMIPHPACLFWVGVFVSSVLVGIIGQMRFWDMDLDSVSLINLLIAISFCSDLIAHPVYIFLITPVPKTAKDGKRIFEPEARLIKARALIEEVSAAAVPACVGTTLSVIAMSTSDAYIFQAFFRIMFLSVVLSVFHALVFVPAFLSFIGPSTSGLQSIRGNHPAGSEENESETTSVTTTRSSVNLINEHEPPKVQKTIDKKVVQKRDQEIMRHQRTQHTQTDQRLIGFVPHRPAPSCHGGAGLRMFYGPRRVWDHHIAENYGGRHVGGGDDGDKSDDNYLPATIRAIPVRSSRRRDDGGERVLRKRRRRKERPITTTTGVVPPTVATTKTETSNAHIITRQRHSYPDIRMQTLQHQQQQIENVGQRGLTLSSEQQQSQARSGRVETIVPGMKRFHV